MAEVKEATWETIDEIVAEQEMYAIITVRISVPIGGDDHDNGTVEEAKRQVDQAILNAIDNSEFECYSSYEITDAHISVEP